MALMRYIVWFVFFRRYLHSLKIKRDIYDSLERREDKTCPNITARKMDISSNCTCIYRAPTFMSKNNTHYKCTISENLGCKVSLQNTKKTYLIESDRFKERTHPMLYNTCSMINKIFLWNARPFNEGVGVWIDVSDIGKKYFHINLKSELDASNIDLKAWCGHVIMIVFRCQGNCSILKVKGSIEYPFDIQLFKNTVTGAEETEDSYNIGIVIGIVITLVIILIVTFVICICRRNYHRNLASSHPRCTRRSTNSITEETSNNRINFAVNDLTTVDFWSQINKYSKDDNYFQGINDDDDNDRFDIPTLNRGFSKERNIRDTKNIADLNFQSSRTINNTLTDFPSVRSNRSNPYNDSVL